jgi:cytidylate kinase
MIIGLAGYARSGKDTVANYLVENYGFTQLAFADPMREALVRLDPFIQVDSMHHLALSEALKIYSWEDLKEHSPDIRPLLQRFGTEVGRNMFGQDFWVEQALKKAAKYENVVFSDCRFVNEAEAVLTETGHVWQIQRPGVQAANSHISEHALDEFNFDVVIHNVDTLEHLYATIDALMGNLSIG